MSAPDPAAVPSPAADATGRPPMNGPIARLTGTPPGTRVVVRSRIVSGFTDTLGELRGCDGAVAIIDTRDGPRPVVLAHVVAMRVVPPPPPRRPRPAR